MKAVTVPAFKATPAITDIPEPAVRPGTIKIKLAAAGLNPFDWKVADGIMKDSMQHVFPLVLGVDGAGVVMETGDGVTRFKTGDRVYGQTIHDPVGEGSYAEYIIVPEQSAMAIAPQSISLVDAAAVPTSGMTALQMLDVSGLKAGQTLLVVGATGGVGSFVVQLATARGLHVIGTASSEAMAEQVRGFGAKEVILYKDTPVLSYVQSNHTTGVDGLIDLNSNAEVFAKHTTLVKEKGAALTTMFVADEKQLAERQLHGGNFETDGKPSSLDALSAVIDSGALRVPVDKKITLEEAPAAIADSRAKKSKGKTIIEIDGSLL